MDPARPRSRIIRLGPWPSAGSTMHPNPPPSAPHTPCTRTLTSSPTRICTPSSGTPSQMNGATATVGTGVAARSSTPPASPRPQSHPRTHPAPVTPSLRETSSRISGSIRHAGSTASVRVRAGHGSLACGASCPSHAQGSIETSSASMSAPLSRPFTAEPMKSTVRTRSPHDHCARCGSRGTLPLDLGDDRGGVGLGGPLLQRGLRAALPVDAGRQIDRRTRGDHRHRPRVVALRHQSAGEGAARWRGSAAAGLVDLDRTPQRGARRLGAARPRTRTPRRPVPAPVSGQACTRPAPAPTPRPRGTRSTTHEPAPAWIP